MTNRPAMLAQAARGPILLIVLGILFALQQGGVLAFSRSWPLLIIAIGLLKLIERMLVGPVPAAPQNISPPQAGYPAGYPPPGTQRTTQYTDFRTQPPFAGQPPPGEPK